MRRWIVIGLVILLLIPTAALGVLYARYLSLDVYEWSGGMGNAVQKDGVLYYPSSDLGKRTVSGELLPGRTVGRFRGDCFLGPKFWVIELQGVDVRQGFTVRGLMYEIDFAAEE